MLVQVSKRNASSCAPTGACCAGLETAFPLRLFRALCDPSRISVLARVAELGPSCTVSEVAGCCPQSLSVVSRHLATLREAGVLDATKNGKEVRYSVRVTELASALRALADLIDPPTSKQKEKDR